MRRCLLLVAAASFGLSLLLFTDLQEVQAQPRSGSDTIRFMAAVRGNNFGNGLQWCVSQGWHESYAAADSYPAGPPDALDEVSQYGSPGWTWSNCHSNNGDLVDLATNGSTSGGSNCTTSAPCPSLIVKGRDTVYTINNCHAIEADLYDYATYDAGTQTGDWKGKQRMLHASATSSPWTSVIHVAWLTWYYDFVTVGTVVSETSPCPWQQPNGHHVHQDFMLPTESQNCHTSNNAAIPAPSPDNPSGQSMDWQKQNPEHFVHSLVHSYSVACVVPGPDAADFLLGPGGALNDTGAGTRSLAATGTPIRAYRCFTQSTWCGYITAYPKLLMAAFWNYLGLSPLDYFRGQQKSFPPWGVDRYWYGPDSQGYYFQVRYDSNFPYGSGQYGCQYIGYGTAMYRLDATSSAVMDTACGISYTMRFSNWTFTGAMIQQLFANFRGANGMNPSAPPTQEDANAWVLNTDWTIVKPRVDAVIRGARNQKDMETLGITPDPGNSFDGQRW